MYSLENSIRILLTLYVTIEQDFNALQFYEEFLSESSLSNENIPKRDGLLIDEAITECIWFQIIIKTSSFLDEWDCFLGVKTTEVDVRKLMLIKKVVSPARKEIMKWRDLKNFRNIIAHNFRNKNHEFSFHTFEKFNIPKDTYELYYLVTFLERMVRVLTHNYKIETNNVVEKVGNEFRNHKRNIADFIRSNSDLENALQTVDDNISNAVWDITRFDLVSSYIEMDK